MQLSRLSVLASAVTALMVGASAQAAPQFTINPDAITGSTAGTPFQATFINGTTSELLTASGNTASGSGWAQFNGFSNGAQTIGAGDHRLTVDYNLYLTFDISATLNGGSMFAPGSTYTVTQLDFRVYADPGRTTTFTNADASDNQGATVNDVGGNDVLLGFGSLLTGNAGFNANTGGAFINALNNFALCTGAGTADMGGTAFASAACTSGMGRAYFAQPVPFYSLAFSAFNNTGQGPEISGNRASITQAIGGVDFLGVPEPTSLALAGLALFGVGAASLRKRKV